MPKGTWWSSRPEAVNGVHHIVWLRCCHVTQEIKPSIETTIFQNALLLLFSLIRRLLCSLIAASLIWWGLFHFAYILHLLLSTCLYPYSQQFRKGKGKKMKSSSSIEEFQAEFNIPMSIGLRFLEENDVNLKVALWRMNCFYRRVISRRV